MDANAVLNEGLGRLTQTARGAVEGLSEDQLTWRVDPDANTIAWLVWHTARELDVQAAPFLGFSELWSSGWRDKFDFDLPPDAMGYGASTADVGKVRSSAELLLGYLGAVVAATRDGLAGLDDDDLDRVIDAAWDPPVTLGVRMVSALDDAVQHLGQAAYVRGLLARATA